MEKLYTGRDFHGFEVGETLVSPGRTITEAHIAAYAGLSGDFNPLHTDEEFARNTVHGGRIAHGMLTAGIAAGMLNRYVDGTAVALLDAQFKLTRAVRAGDTLHISATVANKRLSSKGNSGIVEFGVDMLNQNGETVLSGAWKILLNA
ncbi:MAG: MaoC/PaaZ C-terminal domain-containing protein [Bacillota bacterium]